MTDEQFIKFLSAERVYKARVKSAGSFLDAPRVEYGASQIPITYGREVIDRANAEISSAFEAFSNFVGDVEAYLAEKKRRVVEP